MQNQAATQDWKYKRKKTQSIKRDNKGRMMAGIEL